MDTLDELESRKRLIQAKMAIHRAEMAVHLHDVTAPFRKVQSSVGRITHSPVLRFGLFGALGWLAFSGRWHWFSRVTTWVSPIFLSSPLQLLKKNLKQVAVDLLTRWAGRWRNPS